MKKRNLLIILVCLWIGFVTCVRCAAQQNGSFNYIYANKIQPLYPTTNGLNIRNTLAPLKLFVNDTALTGYIQYWSKKGGVGIDSSKLVTKYDLFAGLYTIDGLNNGLFSFRPTFSSLSQSLETGENTTLSNNGYNYILASNGVIPSHIATLNFDSTGLSYSGNYSNKNSSNLRWIPDKNYVDSLTGKYLPLTGGTVSGLIKYNRNFNALSPTSRSVPDKNYVDSLVSIGNPNYYISVDTAKQNQLFGKKSFASNTTGGYSLSIGYAALRNNTTGSYNIAIGDSVMYDNTVGIQNVGIGYRSLRYNIGSNNTAVGQPALRHCTGTYNVAFGNCLNTSTTGNYNTGINAALSANTTGSNNISVGYQNLGKETTGNYNTSVGNAGLFNIVAQSNCNSFGYAAGKYETGSNALYIDAFDRTNTAGDKAGAIVYGVMSSTPASQTLVTNSAFTATYSVNSPLMLYTAHQTRHNNLWVTDKQYVDSVAANPNLSYYEVNDVTHSDTINNTSPFTDSIHIPQAGFTIQTTGRYLISVSMTIRGTASPLGAPGNFKGINIACGYNLNITDNLPQDQRNDYLNSNTNLPLVSGSQALFHISFTQQQYCTAGQRIRLLKSCLGTWAAGQIVLLQFKMTAIKFQ
jgi:hypothetical protein